MKIVDKKIIKLKVKGRWRECLSYNVITSDGEFHKGGIMTVDKRWFWSCYKPSFAHNTWIKVKYFHNEKDYGFADPYDDDKKPYIICEQVIDAIDHYIVEQLVLS